MTRTIACLCLVALVATAAALEKEPRSPKNGPCVKRGTQSKCKNDGDGCVWDSITETCSAATLCSEIIKKDPCSTTSLGCFWGNNKKCKTATSCARLTDKEVCNESALTCKWSGGSCKKAPKCPQITSKSECYDSSYSCKWNRVTGKCSNPADCYDIVPEVGCVSSALGCEYDSSVPVCRPL